MLFILEVSSLKILCSIDFKINFQNVMCSFVIFTLNKRGSVGLVQLKMVRAWLKARYYENFEE